MSILEIDKELFFFINSGISNPLFDFVCPLIRNKFFWVWLYVLVLFLFIKQQGKKTIYYLILGALIILISDQTSSSIVKPFFNRLRPCNDPLIQNSVHLLVEHCGRGFSFVSTHATNHFAFAFFCITFLNHRFKKVVWVIWASAISFSQVYVGVHFPSDVIVGALLGIFISFVTIKIFDKLFSIIIEKQLI